MKRELRKSMNLIVKELRKIDEMEDLTTHDLFEAKRVFNLSNNLAIEIFFPENTVGKTE